jgi:hypothetical protein
MLRATSEVFLGLTIGCARCHDHKFEPITQADYYRMLAIFAPLDRPRDGRDELDLPIGTRAELDALRERDRQIDAAQAEIDALRRDVRESLLASGINSIPAEAIEAFRLDPSQRTDWQKSLARQYAQALEDELDAAVPEEARERIGELDADIRRLREATPDLPRAYILHEPSEDPPASFLLLRGQATSPGPQVAPGFPVVLVREQPVVAASEGRTSGRRLALARWLTRADHPLTARVIVNRVWQYHFGEGIVRTPNDFGVMGEPPNHPELLDWLAGWFVNEGWSLKKLHRLILTSNAYRMSTRSNPECAAEDPENHVLWRYPYRRLDAEAIRDAMLAVSGQLDRTMYGPGIYLEVPPGALEAHSDPGSVWPAFDERAASRRTIYAVVKRSLVVPMLEVLDFCDTSQSAPRRTTTSTAPQALTLFNGAFVNRQARHLAERIAREVGDDPTRQVERAYLLALGRPPSAEESAAMLAFLASESGAPAEGQADRPAPLSRVCRVLFNLSEFAYTD